MSEVFRFDWFNLPAEQTSSTLAWFGEVFLPELQAQSGVTWVGQYKIRPHGEGPLIEGGPAKLAQIYNILQPIRF